MKWTRKKAVGDIIIASTIQYLTQFILFFRNFIFAKLLGPYDFGIYASIFLFFSYGNYANLGVIDGIYRIVPQELGAGNERRARDFLNTGLWGLNFIISIFTIGIIFYSLLSPFQTIKENRISVALAAFSILINQNFIYALTFFRLKHEFTKSYLLQFLQALIDLILSVILVLKLRVMGIFIGMLLGLLIACFFSLKDVLSETKPEMNIKLLREILTVGFQILMIGFTYGFLMSADKFSVANLFDKSKMGIYSVAVGLGVIPYFASATLGQFVGQRMLEEYGRTKSKESLKIYLDESLLIIAFFVPVISILVIALSEPFIYLFLPRYIESLKIVDKLSVAYYFLSLGTIPGTFLVAINQQSKFLILNFIFIPIVLFLNYLAFKSDLGLLGISYVTFLNFFLRTFMMFWLSYRNYVNFIPLFFSFAKFTAASAPILIAFGLKFLPFSSYLKFGLRILIATLWVIFAMRYFSRKTTIVSDMLGILRDRISVYFDKLSSMF